MTNIIHFNSQDDLWGKAVEVLKDLSAERDGKLIVGVSGGSSSKIFDQLDVGNIDFSEWELYLIDERYVPCDHEHSNYRLIAGKIDDEDQLHDFDTSVPIEKSLQDYFHRLPYRFDVIIYGMGPDGHTASLFPGDEALDTHHLVAHTQTDTFDVPDRLTLTYPTLEKAAHHLVLATGQSKKPVIEALEKGDADYHQYPIAKVLEWENASLFYAE